MGVNDHHQLDGHHDEAARQLGSAAVRLCTMTEASQLLRVSRWQVYQLINQRELTSVKIGRRRLVPLEEIDDFIERLRQRAEATT